MSDVMEIEKGNKPRLVQFLRNGLVALYALGVPLAVASGAINIWNPILAVLFVVGPLSMLGSITYLIAWIKCRNKYNYKTNRVGTVALITIALFVNSVFLYIVTILLTQPIFD